MIYVFVFSELLKEDDVLNVTVAVQITVYEN